MTKREPRVITRRRNITIEGGEVLANFETGRREAAKAKETNRAALISWLDQNFPNYYGPDRNEVTERTKRFDRKHPTTLGIVSADYAPENELWYKESLSKAARLLGTQEDMPFRYWGANGGEDWVDGQHGFQYYGVIAPLPPKLDQPNIRELITEFSQPETRDCVMQSFGGVIVRLTGVVCQVTQQDKTFGFPAAHEKDLEDAFLMRAWRTE